MINEYELSVLLGVRNCLDRFIEMIELTDEIARVTKLNFTTKPSVLHEHVVNIRTDLQGIIMSYKAED